MVQAMSLISDLPSIVLLGGISDNIPPVLFLVLMGVCAILIIVGAVADMMPEREAKVGAEVQEDAGAAAKRAAKAEQLKAKAEEKARKKAAKAESKAAKGKKGKSKAAPTPIAEPSEAAAVETIDFSEPE